MGKRPLITIAVLAHQEERRIALCLNSLPLGRADVAIHVAVNGSRDRTASIARAIAADAGNVIVYDWEEGGKSRSWNRLMLDAMEEIGTTHIMIDGDGVIAPGSIDALSHAMMQHPHANIIAGLPLNGRLSNHYQHKILTEHGLFGDLYAIRGTFLERFRASGIRLPDDLVGDDGLVGALAKTDLGPLSDWDQTRLMTCPGAGFYCETTSIWSFRSLINQYQRMINYSVRHFQNKMITPILREKGPSALPHDMASLYPEWLGRLKPRPEAEWHWFDRQALARMRRAAEAG
jgi:glycosyltransferase involved in cell wall biosynthesis